MDCTKTKKLVDHQAFRIGMILVCIVLALVSNRVLAKNYASADYETNQKTIAYLDEKKNKMDHGRCDSRHTGSRCGDCE